jgi:putative Holliday junction resolvase
MTRILALDWGSVRIGVAISDELNIIATAFEKPLESKSALPELEKIITENSVDKIIVGVPWNLKSLDSDSTREARKFIEQLKKSLSIEIVEVDERFSTAEALSRLQSQEKNAKQARADKDCLSAQLLLENYLSKQKNNE